MNDIRFEWNKLKALANKRKHGVSFEEALDATPFLDISSLVSSPRA